MEGKSTSRNGTAFCVTDIGNTFNEWRCQECRSIVSHYTLVWPNCPTKHRFCLFCLQRSSLLNKELSCLKCKRYPVDSFSQLFLLASNVPRSAFSFSNDAQFEFCVFCEKDLKSQSVLQVMEHHVSSCPILCSSQKSVQVERRKRIQRARITSEKLKACKKLVEEQTV